MLIPAPAVGIEVVITASAVRQIFIDLMGGYTGYFNGTFPKFFTSYFPIYYTTTPLSAVSNVNASIYLAAGTSVQDTEYFRYVKSSSTRILYYAGTANGAGGIYSFSVSSAANYISFRMTLPGVYSVNKVYWVPVFLQSTPGLGPEVNVNGYAQFSSSYNELTVSTSIEIQLYNGSFSGGTNQFTTGNVYDVSFPPFVFEGGSYYN